MAEIYLFCITHPLYPTVYTPSEHILFFRPSLISIGSHGRFLWRIQSPNSSLRPGWALYCAHASSIALNFYSDHVQRARCASTGGYPARSIPLTSYPSTFYSLYLCRGNGAALNCAHCPSTCSSFPTLLGWASRLFPLRASNEGHLLSPTRPVDTRAFHCPGGRALGEHLSVSHSPIFVHSITSLQRYGFLLSTVPIASLTLCEDTARDNPLRALTDHRPHSFFQKNLWWAGSEQGLSLVVSSQPPHCHPVTSYPFSSRHRLTKFV